MDDSIKRTQIPPISKVLIVVKTSDIENDCARVGGFCNQYNVNLIVVANHWFDNFINYGYQSLSTDIPITISPTSERRAWRIKEVEDNVYKNILFADVTGKIKATAQENGKGTNNLLPLGTDLFLLQNNSLTTLELLKILKIDIRPF